MRTKDTKNKTQTIPLYIMNYRYGLDMNFYTKLYESYKNTEKREGVNDPKCYTQVSAQR